MKVSELLRLLLRPLIIAGAALVALTFFTQWIHGRSAMLDYLLGIVDLREERTFGTWFEGCVFLLAGLSFFLVSRHRGLTFFGRGVLVLSALGFCFLSADELLSLHEFFGYQFEQLTGNVDGTRLAERGYSWVLLYGPVALGMFIVMNRLYRTLCRGIRPAARVFSVGAWLGIAAVLLMEILESRMVLANIAAPYMTCFEELCELSTLMLFYTANLLIAEENDL
jgi:hypothetical protein